MIANIKKTKEILDSYGLQAKKKYGQNFLVDANVVRKIVETAKITRNSTVIEIGPGIGAMTEILSNYAKKVICFEIDHDMVTVLNNEIKKDNVQIIESDFLKVDINDYINNEKVIVVSNLPYYITTPIVFKLLEEKCVSDIYVMVQDEVALRFVSGPGSKDYGSLSVMIKYYSDAKYEFKVTRNCFYPVPNVDSAIISMKKIQNDYNVNNEPNFLKFIQNIFEMRRKTLMNNILKKYTLDKEKINASFAELGLDQGIRAEALTLNQMVDLYKKLF